MACLCLARPIADTHHYCMHPRTVSFFPDHRPGRKDCWDSLSYSTDLQYSNQHTTVDFLVQHTTRSLLSSSLPPSSLAHGSSMIGSRLDALMGKRAAIPVQCDDQSGATPEQLGPRGTKFLGYRCLPITSFYIISHQRQVPAWRLTGLAGFQPLPSFAAFARHRLFWNFFGASDWPSSPASAACLPRISSCWWSLLTKRSEHRSVTQHRRRGEGRGGGRFYHPIEERSRDTVQPLRHQLRHAATDELPAPRGKSVMEVGWRRGRGRGRGRGTGSGRKGDRTLGRDRRHWQCAERCGLCSPEHDRSLHHWGTAETSNVAPSRLPNLHASKLPSFPNHHTTVPSTSQFAFHVLPRSEMFSEIFYINRHY
jgi:hypothetical protein